VNAIEEFLYNRDQENKEAAPGSSRAERKAYARRCLLGGGLSAAKITPNYLTGGRDEKELFRFQCRYLAVARVAAV